MTAAFSAGQKLTAADLNAAPRPVVGDWLSADGTATSGTTEKLVATTPSFTPLANMIYRVVYVFRYSTDVNAAGDVFFTRIRETSIAGTIRSASRFDPLGNSSSPLQAFDVDYWFNSGSSPSSTVFCGTVFRSSGDGTITPLAYSSVVVYLMGTSTNFT